MIARLSSSHVRSPATLQARLRPLHSANSASSPTPTHAVREAEQRKRAVPQPDRGGDHERGRHRDLHPGLALEGGRTVRERGVPRQQDEKADERRGRPRGPTACPHGRRLARPFAPPAGGGHLRCGGHPKGGDASISRAMRRPATPTLLAALAACACLALPAGAGASPLDEYQRTGHITPCNYNAGQLQGSVPNDVAQYAPEFQSQLQAAARDRARGCGGASGGGGGGAQSGAAAAAGVAGGGGGSGSGGNGGAPGPPKATPAKRIGPALSLPRTVSPAASGIGTTPARCSRWRCWRRSRSSPRPWQWSRACSVGAAAGRRPDATRFARRACASGRRPRASPTGLAHAARQAPDRRAHAIYGACVSKQDATPSTLSWMTCPSCEPFDASPGEPPGRSRHGRSSTARVSGVRPPLHDVRAARARSALRHQARRGTPTLRPHQAPGRAVTGGAQAAGRTGRDRIRRWQDRG